MTINYQTIALQAGIIFEEEKGSGITYWTTGDSEEALKDFADLIIQDYKSKQTSSN